MQKAGQKMGGRKFSSRKLRQPKGWFWIIAAQKFEKEARKYKNGFLPVRLKKAN
ncbi:MAG: hypothetical protein ACKVUS_09605 [Saprospiraceae bacterium]